MLIQDFVLQCDCGEILVKGLWGIVLFVVTAANQTCIIHTTGQVHIHYQGDCSVQETHWFCYTASFHSHTVCYCNWTVNATILKSKELTEQNCYLHESWQIWTWKSIRKATNPVLVAFLIDFHLDTREKDEHPASENTMLSLRSDIIYQMTIKYQ